MDNEKCDLFHLNGVKEKKLKVIDGFTIKYHVMEPLLGLKARG